ncbi:MAG TPA: ATP-binding protein [Gammaproteobacteria bacterium]|nr:ATP-binding protein [Gammaproteobacteria bacterium]
MLISLRRRLLLVAGVVVLVFLGLTGGVLDQAFRQSLERAEADRLLGVVYTILAAANLEQDKLALPAELPDARLSTPASGLYAMVLGTAGPEWRSPSLLAKSWQPDLRLQAGETRSYRTSAASGSLHALAYGLSWEDAFGRQAAFTIHVAEEPAGYQAQLAAFRASLWGWLGAAAVALLIAQVLVLHWSLHPLTAVARDLRDIELGRAEELRGRYPLEIAGLIRGLNRLLKSERERTARYRDTLANLAHSLKTPLTVLRTALESGHIEQAEALEQVDRIDASVQYQLRRAAASGHLLLSAPLPVAPVLERVLRTLAKAYYDKTLQVESICAPATTFPGSEGDLMELLGNLLDNAHKWALNHIRIHAEPLADGLGLLLVVEDDGPGIDPAKAEALLARGVRADEQVPGHGIGLAVVADLVAGINGRLQIERSDLGGARFRVELPGW